LGRAGIVEVGADGLPQLEAVGAVLGAEEEGPADVRQIVGVAAAARGVDVLDHRRVAGVEGGHGLPQLLAVGAVVGREEEGAADVGEALDLAVAPGVYLDLGGVVEGRIRPPELVTVGGTGPGLEEDAAADVGELVGPAPAGIEGRVRVDVLDQLGAAAGAVGLPGLLAVGAEDPLVAVAGAEEERAADVGEL